jgi:serine phosphatase RsbU (regulator of sigma subunit)
MRLKSIKFALFILLWCCPAFVFGQTGERLSLSAESFANSKKVDLSKLTWKYRPGDETIWATPNFDDQSWEQIQNTRIDLKNLPASGWNERAWFRLRFQADETTVNRTLTVSGRQLGASEIYLDGNLIARFGEIGETGEIQFNPNSLPVPFEIDRAGEHVLAIRYAASEFKDLSSGVGAWLAHGKVSPGFVFSLADVDVDVAGAIQRYADNSARRIGVFIIGILTALALLHFLLFLFYRAERANLFYSIYATAFAVNLFCGNLLTFGHGGITQQLALGITGSMAFNISNVALLAFLHVAFRRSIGAVFWMITALCAISAILSGFYLNNLGPLNLVPMAAIFATISFSIYLLVRALIRKLPGAWILLTGVQVFAFGMLYQLLSQLGVIKLPTDVGFLGELAIILGIPVSVSVYLARNFARVNRDLTEQLAQVEELSKHKIEQERHAAELRAENERRAKELEEARQLQISMLPKKLPQIPNLEIAVYMKPATEVGGDYYDFHVGADGTLTVAVGDATGHGLKAGTVVTAAKALFANLAHEPDITYIFRQSSAALKKINLRGLFMAMTILKLKDNRVNLSLAGMPAVLIFRDKTKQVEEIAIKALPLGSIANFAYQEQQFDLFIGDCVVMMSDGFPEMFNEENEILGFDKAAEILPDAAHGSAQEIINRLVKTAEQWAGTRPQDDDVTFVVLKMKEIAR